MANRRGKSKQSMNLGAPNRSRESGSKVGAEATIASVRGLVLVAVAVIVGVVLLQVVDDGTPKADKTPTETTTTTDRSASTTATTVEPTELIPTSELRVQVLNGRGVSGVAGEMTEALRAKGYTSILDPGDAELREGDAVACKDGLTGEAALLVTQVGEGTVAESMPDPLPGGADSTADCLVILGSAASA